MHSVRWKHEPPPVRVPELDMDDSDILPKCEFNRSVVKRDWKKLGRKVLTWENCEETAVWMVFLSIKECKKHDHVVMVCDNHRYSFSNGDVTNFKCDNNPVSFDWEVTRVERI